MASKSECSHAYSNCNGIYESEVESVISWSFSFSSWSESIVFFPSFDCCCCCCYFVHDFAMLRQICVRDIVGNLLNYRLDEALILRSIIIAVFVRMRNCQLFEIHTLFSWFIWTSMGEKERKDEKKRKSSDENRFRFCLLLLTKNPIFINPWT